MSIDIYDSMTYSVAHLDNPVSHTYITNVGHDSVENKKEKTVREVYESLDKDQKELLYSMVDAAISEETFVLEQGTWDREEEHKKKKLLLKQAINSIYGLEPTKKNAKGETIMPTGMISTNKFFYSLVETPNRPIFNADGSIKKVIFNGAATIVIWNDGTKTVVKCMEGDEYDPEKGLMMCIMEKLLGGKSKVKKFFKKHIPEEDTASIIESVSRALDELKNSFLSIDPKFVKEENKE